jgi:hypothetical protein
MIDGHGNSNADPTAPGGLVLDNMDSYDGLPPALRAFIFASIAPWSSLAVNDILQSKLSFLTPSEAIKETISVLRQNERAQHDAAVKFGVIPKVPRYAFALKRVREETTLDAQKRQRLAKAIDRRLKRIRHTEGGV